MRVIRLMVVDDDIRVRSALMRTITFEDDLVIVAEAGDAAGALVLAERHAPSVALVDMLLPDDVAGLALVRKLRKLVQRPPCAVVAMSVRDGLRDSSLAAGAVAFVEKAGDIDAILDAVRAAGPTS